MRVVTLLFAPRLRVGCAAPLPPIALATAPRALADLTIYVEDAATLAGDEAEEVEDAAAVGLRAAQAHVPGRGQAESQHSHQRRTHRIDQRHVGREHQRRYDQKPAADSKKAREHSRRKAETGQQRCVGLAQLHRTVAVVIAAAAGHYLSQHLHDGMSVGVGWGYHLFNTVPYALTLLILVLTCKPGSVAAGSPGELSSTR